MPLCFVLEWKATCPYHRLRYRSALQDFAPATSHCWHTEDETKWSLFCKRHFEINSRFWNWYIWFQCYWNLFPRVHLTIRQHSISSYIGVERGTRHFLNQRWLSLVTNINASLASISWPPLYPILRSFLYKLEEMNLKLGPRGAAGKSWVFLCLESKVHGANMGLIWGQHNQNGPDVGPMNFAIWVCSNVNQRYAIIHFVSLHATMSHYNEPRCIESSKTYGYIIPQKSTYQLCDVMDSCMAAAIHSLKWY